MEESSFIITFDKNGKLFRHDTYDGDDHEVIIINGDNKTVFVCDDGQNWEDKSEYYDAYASSAQSQILIYKASTYSYQAWPQQPNQNIAGKSCKMYSLGFGSFKMTIGVWNGLVMLLEVPEAIPFMAEAATIKVPAKAFTTECFIPDWFTKK